MASVPKDKVCFTCTAVDGRVVRLHKSTYYGHIIRPQKPEIQRDYAFPAGEIERALVNAVGPPKPEASNRRISYLGPKVKPRPPKTGEEQWKVVVQPDDSGNTGWVVAAYPLLVF